MWFFLQQVHCGYSQLAGGPVLVTFSHNLQIMDRKLDRKHNNIDCWYNPGNGRLITYTYAYKKKLWLVVVDAQEKIPKLEPELAISRRQ